MFKIILGIVLALLVLGAAGVVALKVLTALFHAFKQEDPPGENDNNWSRDQAKEVK